MSTSSLDTVQHRIIQPFGAKCSMVFWWETVKRESVYSYNKVPLCVFKG